MSNEFNDNSDPYTTKWFPGSPLEIPDNDSGLRSPARTGGFQRGPLTRSPSIFNFTAESAVHRERTTVTIHHERYYHANFNPAASQALPVQQSGPPRPLVSLSCPQFGSQAVETPPSTITEPLTFRTAVRQPESGGLQQYTQVPEPMHRVPMGFHEQARTQKHQANAQVNVGAMSHRRVRNTVSSRHSRTSTHHARDNIRVRRPQVPRVVGSPEVDPSEVAVEDFVEPMGVVRIGGRRRIELPEELPYEEDPRKRLNGIMAILEQMVKDEYLSEDERRQLEEEDREGFEEIKAEDCEEEP